MEYLGNKALLELPKWGFLASRRVPSSEVMQCYDWAAARAAAGDCVVSGFSSKMERDVLHFLLKGNCPVIVVLARSMYKELPQRWQQAVEDNRMLVISTSSAPRQSRQTAQARNQYVAEICDTVYLFGVTATSTLYQIRQLYPEKCNKDMVTLQLPIEKIADKRFFSHI